MKKTVTIILIISLSLTSIVAATSSANLNININPVAYATATIISKNKSIPATFNELYDLILLGRTSSSNPTIHQYSITDIETRVESNKEQIGNILTFYYPGSTSATFNMSLIFDNKLTYLTNNIDYKLYYGASGENEIVSNTPYSDWAYNWATNPREIKVTKVWFAITNPDQILASPNGTYSSTITINIETT